MLNLERRGCCMCLWGIAPGVAAFAGAGVAASFAYTVDSGAAEECQPVMRFSCCEGLVVAAARVEWRRMGSHRSL